MDPASVQTCRMIAGSVRIGSDTCGSCDNCRKTRLAQVELAAHQQLLSSIDNVVSHFNGSLVKEEWFDVFYWHEDILKLKELKSGCASPGTIETLQYYDRLCMMMECDEFDADELKTIKPIWPCQQNCQMTTKSTTFNNSTINKISFPTNNRSASNGNKSSQGITVNVPQTRRQQWSAVRPNPCINKRVSPTVALHQTSDRSKAMNVSPTVRKIDENQRGILVNASKENKPTAVLNGVNSNYTGSEITNVTVAQIRMAQSTMTRERYNKCKNWNGQIIKTKDESKNHRSTISGDNISQDITVDVPQTQRQQWSAVRPNSCFIKRVSSTVALHQTSDRSKAMIVNQTVRKIDEDQREIFVNSFKKDNLTVLLNGVNSSNDSGSENIHVTVAQTQMAQSTTTRERCNEFNENLNGRTIETKEVNYSKVQQKQINSTPKKESKQVNHNCVSSIQQRKVKPIVQSDIKLVNYDIQTNLNNLKQLTKHQQFKFIESTNVCSNNIVITSKCPQIYNKSSTTKLPSNCKPEPTCDDECVQHLEKNSALDQQLKKGSTESTKNKYDYQYRINTKFKFKHETKFISKPTNPLNRPTNFNSTSPIFDQSDYNIFNVNPVSANHTNSIELNNLYCENRTSLKVHHKFQINFKCDQQLNNHNNQVRYKKSININHCDLCLVQQIKQKFNNSTKCIKTSKSEFSLYQRNNDFIQSPVYKNKLSQLSTNKSTNRNRLKSACLQIYSVLSFSSMNCQLNVISNRNILPINQIQSTNLNSRISISLCKRSTSVQKENLKSCKQTILQMEFCLIIVQFALDNKTIPKLFWRSPKTQRYKKPPNTKHRIRNQTTSISLTLKKTISCHDESQLESIESSTTNMMSFYECADCKYNMVGNTER